MDALAVCNSILPPRERAAILQAAWFAALRQEDAAESMRRAAGY